VISTDTSEAWHSVDPARQMPALLLSRLQTWELEEGETEDYLPNGGLAQPESLYCKARKARMHTWNVPKKDTGVCNAHKRRQRTRRRKKKKVATTRVLTKEIIQVGHTPLFRRRVMCGSTTPGQTVITVEGGSGSSIMHTSLWKEQEN
jgi:hypothetical protein